ncbi:MAG: hypothetical protein ACI9DM_002718 [Cyclobacteriaceae bacterium]|jgi:hypothetical protein
MLVRKPRFGVGIILYNGRGMTYWKITFFNIQSGIRESYLNNTCFNSELKAKSEIERLIKLEEKRSEHHKTRIDFRAELINVK